MHVPEQFQAKYRNLLFKHHEAISQNKFDLGRTDTLMHEIALKTQEPIYVKIAEKIYLGVRVQKRGQ